jgi:two-component system, cell cycle response regulator
MQAPKILLVEDDANVVLLLSRRLQRDGYELITAGTVEAAREVSGGDWDIALLDRNLPDGDGLFLCEELRSAKPDAYLIVLTGDDRDEAKLEGFARGADDYVTKPFNFAELEARIRAGVRIVGLQKQLQELSMTDGLTSLRNRRAFDQYLPTAIEHARRYERPLSLAIIDIDRFKAINDTFGHDTGDAILRGVAQILGAGTRQTDYAARIGGEEFAVLLPETALFDGLQFAEKLRTSVAGTTIRVGGHEHHVTISVGIANVPHSIVKNGEELFRAADQALYRAKANGRNRVEMERRKNRLFVTHPRSDRPAQQQSAPPTQPRTPEARFQ